MLISRSVCLLSKTLKTCRLSVISFLTVLILLKSNYVVSVLIHLVRVKALRLKLLSYLLLKNPGLRIKLKRVTGLIYVQASLLKMLYKLLSVFFVVVKTLKLTLRKSLMSLVRLLLKLSWLLTKKLRTVSLLRLLIK